MDNVTETAEKQSETPVLYPPPWRATIWLWSMTLLQSVWLVMIGLLQVTDRVDKIPPLLVFTAAAALFVIYLPPRAAMMITAAAGRAVQQERRALAGLLLFVAVVGILFAASQRIWPFDEEGLWAAVSGVAEGGIAELMRSYSQRGWLSIQHPPLIPAVYGLLLRFSIPTLLMARLMTLLFALGTGVVTFRIGNKLFGTPVGLLAAAVFFSMPLVYRLGTVLMVEIPLTFFFTLAILLTLNVLENPRLRRFWPLLIVVAVGTFIKYTMVLVLPILLLLIGLHLNRRQAARIFGLLLLVLLLVGTVGGVLLSRLDVLQLQLQTIQEYAGLVLSTRYGRQLLLETYTNRLPSAIGVYHAPLLVLGAWGSWQAWRRQPQKKVWLRREGVPVYWFGMVAVVLSLTLPDHRYFLATFPALAILIAAGLRDLSARLPSRNGTLLSWRVLLLAHLFVLSSLYLFVDWNRANQLFLGF